MLKFTSKINCAALLNNSVIVTDPNGDSHTTSSSSTSTFVSSSVESVNVSFPGIRFHNVTAEQEQHRKRDEGISTASTIQMWEATRQLVEKLLKERSPYEKLIKKGIIVPRELPVAFNSSEDTKLHEKLPSLKILPLTSELIYTLEGPVVDELFGGDGTIECFESMACGWSISTYPHLPEHKLREGDPICDKYSIHGYSNRTVFVITDGCNWGRRSWSASGKANKVFGKAIKQSMDQITDLRKAGLALLRALDQAHYSIIQTATESFEPGSTTLLGGMVLQMEKKDKKKWVLLCLSVGDCKVYHYSLATGKFVDVTKGNRRAVNDICDPGGRIGLYVDNQRPDLRNIGFYVHECNEGDIVIGVSDGVHDNLDPQHHGLKPKAVNIPLDDWEEVVKNVDEVVEKKTKYATDFLEKMFKDGEVTPLAVTARLLEHARNITKPGRVFMETNPNKRVPRDEVSYPGKMDHTTCLSFRITTLQETARKPRPPVPPRSSLGKSTTNLSAMSAPSRDPPLKTISTPNLLSVIKKARE
eukprot:TRINITY_DN10885_c0_g1_i1.p1 TRINITY_DN10885_c0_g1~~TRINITY_DN10885_c0_g1_i1.p1  ORF type:complete len:530 (+),score=88.89 TRINITY_DN10885_c0_g1_i1:281-1870(+)